MKISVKMLVSAIFAIGLLASGPGSANAEMYKWKDDSGAWHFTENPASIPAKYRNKDKVDTVELDTLDETSHAPAKKSSPNKNKKVSNSEGVPERPAPLPKIRTGVRYGGTH